MPPDAAAQVLIAGGSSGLGLACAEHLAGRGIPLLLVARRQDVLERVAKTLREKGAHVTAYAADLSTTDGVAALRRAVDADGRPVKWLINAVGVGLYGPLEQTSPAQIEHAVRTNLLAPLLTARTFIDQLIATRGVICNIASRAALRGIAGESVYCATKWGIRGFTEALREEVVGKGVRVLGVYPGPIASPFWDPWRPKLSRTDWHTFMPAEAVARQIVHAVLDVQDITITDLFVSRAPDCSIS